MNFGGTLSAPVWADPKPHGALPTHTASLDRQSSSCQHTRQTHTAWCVLDARVETEAADGGELIPSCPLPAKTSRPSRQSSELQASFQVTWNHGERPPCPRGPCASGNFQDIWRGGSWRRRELLAHPSLAMAEPHLEPACWLGAQGRRP